MRHSLAAALSNEAVHGNNGNGGEGAVAAAAGRAAASSARPNGGAAGTSLAAGGPLVRAAPATARRDALSAAPAPSAPDLPVYRLARSSASAPREPPPPRSTAKKPPRDGPRDGEDLGGSWTCFVDETSGARASFAYRASLPRACARACVQDACVRICGAGAGWRSIASRVPRSGDSARGAG